MKYLINYFHISIAMLLNSSIAFDTKLNIIDKEGEKPIIDISQKRDPKSIIFIFPINRKVNWLLRWCVEQACKLLLCLEDNTDGMLYVIRAYADGTTGSQMIPLHALIAFMLRCVGYVCDEVDINNIFVGDNIT